MGKKTALMEVSNASGFYTMAITKLNFYLQKYKMSRKKYHNVIHFYRIAIMAIMLYNIQQISD